MTMNGGELAIAVGAGVPRLDADTVGLFRPEVVFPAQYFDARPGQREIEGERRLMVAILEDAIRSFQKYATASRPRGRRLFAEAAQWIFEDGSPWLFSFESICAILDLNPVLLRDTLQEWKQRLETAPGADMRLRRLRLRTLRPHRVSPPRRTRRKDRSSELR
ncbi:MAG: hypothetical protein ACE5I7_00200 [Candidatus Binatia bacterium]